MADQQIDTDNDGETRDASDTSPNHKGERPAERPQIDTDGDGRTRDPSDTSPTDNGGRA